MSKFQKSAIVLGAIYLICRILGQLSDHLFGPEITSTFSNKIIRLVPYFIANTCFALLLLFNALRHKSKAATTAAIIGGTAWGLCICIYILNILHFYYEVMGNGHLPHYFFELWNTINIFIDALLIIAVGFFADSNRKNKVVLISSIVGIGVLLLCNLYWFVIWRIWWESINSTFAHYHINDIFQIIHLIAMSSLFVCAATVKEKK